MSVRKMLYIGLCFSGFMCLNALAMTPASDAELAGVTAASDGECIDSGNACNYSLMYCAQRGSQEACTNANPNGCEIRTYGPSNNDKCRDDDKFLECTLSDNGWCIKYQVAECNHVGGEGYGGCDCQNPSGVDQFKGSRKYCN